MSWLRTVLDVSSVAMGAAQLSKLHDLEQRQATEAVARTILAELREQIFKYNRAAKELVELFPSNPLTALAGLKLLHFRISEWGITPSLFPEIQDKEYCADTLGFIHKKVAELSTQVSAEQLEEVDEVVDAAAQLPKYQFYVDSYDDVQQYREAFSSYEMLKGRNGCAATLLLWFGYWVLWVTMVTFVIGTMLSPAFLNIADPLWSAPFAAGVAAILVLVLVFLINSRYVKKKTFQQAKKIVEEIEKKVDIEKFGELEKELGRNKGKVVELQQQAEGKIAHFFGSSDAFGYIEAA